MDKVESLTEGDNDDEGDDDEEGQEGGSSGVGTGEVVVKHTVTSIAQEINEEIERINSISLLSPPTSPAPAATPSPAAQPQVESQSRALLDRIQSLQKFLMTIRPGDDLSKGREGSDPCRRWFRKVS